MNPLAQIKKSISSSPRIYSVKLQTESFGEILLTKHWNEPNDSNQNETCTEIPLPLCKDGINDMFYKEITTEESFNSFCQQKYGVKPRPGWLKTLYGWERLESASNIIFSNGMLDPWSAGGIFKSPNKNIQILKIPSGAHHIDLRKSNPLDTTDIKRARKIEINAIKRWILQWKA